MHAQTFEAAQWKNSHIRVLLWTVHEPGDEDEEGINMITC